MPDGTFVACTRDAEPDDAEPPAPIIAASSAVAAGAWKHASSDAGCVTYASEQCAAAPPGRT